MIIAALPPTEYSVAAMDRSLPTRPMLIRPHQSAKTVFDQGDSRLHLSVG